MTLPHGGDDPADAPLPGRLSVVAKATADPTPSEPEEVPTEPDEPAAVVAASQEDVDPAAVAEKRALARRLVEEAKARAPTPEKQAPAQVPEPSPGPRRAYRLMGAQEALRAAIEAEAAVEARTSKKKSDAKRRKRKAIPAKKPVEQPVAVPPPESAMAFAPDAILGVHAPGLQLLRTVLIEDTKTLAALWTAHRVRAVRGNELIMSAAAGRILAAIESGARVAAAEVLIGDEAHAVFFDLGSGLILAVLPDPEVLLAGL